MIGCTVGEHNADIVARLADGRVLALECKASNSEINSRKRINKEVAVDAGRWVRQFGEQNLVPAAVIQGVVQSCLSYSGAGNARDILLGAPAH